jgi:hypothetical protein
MTGKLLARNLSKFPTMNGKYTGNDNVLFTSFADKTGVGYLVLVTSAGAVDSVIYPSDSHLGNPPSRTLDLVCPKALNMKRARGDEKMPCESYLKNFKNLINVTRAEYAHDNMRRWQNAKFFYKPMAVGFKAGHVDVPQASAKTRPVGIICFKPRE